MSDSFSFDVFLSYSSKDKGVVRPIAERLLADGLRVWFDGPGTIEEGLEQSRVLVLCMSANAFGAEWEQLEAGTFRFRDPLNAERRFVPLRLDEAPIKRSLSQFLYINWWSVEREYSKLLEACQPPAAEADAAPEDVGEKAIQLDHDSGIITYAFAPDGKRALTGASDNTVRLWDLKTGQCLGVLEGHAAPNGNYEPGVWTVKWSADQRRALSGGPEHHGSDMGCGKRALPGRARRPHGAGSECGLES